jgi:hypothetical protein
MDPNTYTAETFSKALGVEKDRGYGFLRFLEALNLVENLGPAPKEPKAKGKGPIVYRVKSEAAAKLSEIMSVL